MAAGPVARIRAQIPLRLCFFLVFELFVQVLNAFVSIGLLAMLDISNGSHVLIQLIHMLRMGLNENFLERKVVKLSNFRFPKIMKTTREGLKSAHRLRLENSNYLNASRILLK